MKIGLVAKAALAVVGSLAVGAPSGAEAASSFTFNMVPSNGQTCLPGAKGRVTLNALGIVETMHLEVSGLPANKEFNVFVIQVPTAPFGISWYQGGVITDADGVGVADFAGRFSVETFTVAPGIASAPVVFKDTPFPDVNKNPATGPVHSYHLGIWFESPADAAAAGCPATETPFSGTHTAGVQVLNTSNFPVLNGPLRHFQP